VYSSSGRLYSPQVQKQQIVQQQQQIFIPNNLNKNINNNDIQQELSGAAGATHPNEEHNETDDSPLPVWKLKMPRNAVEVVLERVEGGKSVDKFRLDSDVFENKTTTSYSSDYYRYVDVTSYGIVTDSWYSICISLSISVNKKMSICRHCTLLKASTTTTSDKVLSMALMDDYYTTDAIRLKYQVEDLPFPLANVVTKIFLDNDKVARCLGVDSAHRHAVVESIDPIKADTVVYVDLKGLSETSEYAVTSSLVAEWKDDPKRVPLTAMFYLNPGKTQSIPKCSRVTY